MTALTRVTRGENPASSDKLNQVIDAWNGNTAGINQGNSPVSLTAINDPINYAAALRNADAAGKGLIIYAPDGVTPLLRVDKTNGVFASPDGTAAADRVVTLSATQTLTNKTLTAPVISGAITGSGTGTLGAWTTFTPTLSQGALTLTSIAGRYLQIGKLIVASVDVVINSTGSATTPFTLGSMPVATVNASGTTPPCWGRYFDTSASVHYVLVGYWATSTSCRFVSNNAGDFGTSPGVTAGAGDELHLTYVYEAA